MDNANQTDTTISHDEIQAAVRVIHRNSPPAVPGQLAVATCPACGSTFSTPLRVDLVQHAKECKPIIDYIRMRPKHN